MYHLHKSSLNNKPNWISASLCRATTAHPILCTCSLANTHAQTHTQTRTLTKSNQITVGGWKMITQCFIFPHRSSSAFLSFFSSVNREERPSKQYYSSLLKRILGENQIKMLFIYFSSPSLCYSPSQRSEYTNNNDSCAGQHHALHISTNSTELDVNIKSKQVHNDVHCLILCPSVLGPMGWGDWPLWITPQLFDQFGI